MRMQEIATIAAPLRRAVREAARTAGKNVELTVTGGETELDRAILEELVDPLVHLLRNAVAHGVETSSERAEAGKPAVGRIELRAGQRAGLVEIAVVDDGRGVSAALLREEGDGAALADRLATPGFSSATEVTALAGRGVGLDAVKRFAESHGGTLAVHSVAGRGTEVTLALPFTLALVEVLLFERGPHVFGLPLANVDEVVQVRTSIDLGGRPRFDLRGEAIPLADIADLIGADAPAALTRPPAIVVGAARPARRRDVRPAARRGGRRHQRIRAAALRRARLSGHGAPRRRPDRARARPGRARPCSAPARRSSRRGACRSVEASRARRRGLVHRPRAPAQHPRGRGLRRDDGGGRTTRAANPRERRRDRARRQRRRDAVDGRDRDDRRHPRRARRMPRCPSSSSRRMRPTTTAAVASTRVQTRTSPRAPSSKARCSPPSSGSSADEVEAHRHLRGLAYVRGGLAARARARRDTRGRRRVHERGGDDRRAARAASRPRDDGPRAAGHVGARGGRADHELAAGADPHPLGAPRRRRDAAGSARSRPARSTRSRRHGSISATRQAPTPPPCGGGRPC